MVSRMFRIETEVDKERRDLLRKRLRETNTAASPVLRALRGTPQEREVPLHLWALDDAGALAGGLVGHTWATWLHVTYLWVDDRRRGARPRLPAARRGGADGPRRARLHRVPPGDLGLPGARILPRQGYEVVSVIPDYPPGITEYTLTKTFRRPGGGPGTAPGAGAA